MDKEGFGLYLKKGGRSPSAVNRCMKFVSEFEDFLQNSRNGTQLEYVQADDLIEYVMMLDSVSKTKAKGYLWAIRYYYDFNSNEEIRDLAGILREERINRKPFSLKDFRGVDPVYVNTLAENGIRNIDQMLEAGGTLNDRKSIARSTNIPQSAILEFVKLSDLARIPGVKSIRARLYCDAGVDTVEKIAALEPDELRTIIVDYVAESGFEGIPTLSAEAQYTVLKVRNLPSIVEY
jgi:predicted flap endonuclease-1-like 5' DNA nuclease